MQNRVWIIIILLTYITKCEINPNICNYYYNSSNAPQQCNTNITQCYFTDGLSQLVGNVSKSYKYQLCLDLPDYNIYIKNTTNTNQTIDNILSIFIYANNLEIINNYSLMCTESVVIIAQSNIYLSTVTITGYKIWMFADNLQINNSMFVNQSTIQSQCSCLISKRDCTWNFAYPQLFDSLTSDFNISILQQYNYSALPNNSATFVALDTMTINGTHIRYTIIGLFSTTININASIVSASGLGYPSGSGPGCGYFDEVLNQLLGCKGSGGSYGGFGGNSSPENCYLLVSRPPYGSFSYPSNPGSGGGFFLPHSRESSAGGGIINIQAMTLIVNFSLILSEGKTGIQGGGGGAGGSISIDCNFTNGTLTTISANGGRGDKMSSSGAGGRIRIWNHFWRNQLTIPNLTNTYIITASGGANCEAKSLSCGENGSVLTSPCKPGYQLSLPSYICTPCGQGFYQMTYGYTYCIACPPKPDNSTWVTNNTNEPFYLYQPCNYTCVNDTISYAGKCLTKTQYYFQMFELTNIIISISMIGVALFVYLLIRLARRIARQQKILYFDDPSLNESYRKKFFRLQDLPYHEMRLYCSGQNHPFNPWRITTQAENNFCKEMKQPITKINNIITKVIKEINVTAEYSKWQKLLLMALRYTYYPCSRLFLSSMRKRKARIIFQEVDKFNKKIPEFENLGIKFHVKPQQTVASLQIFDFNKSVLDFYLQNYYPLYFMLEKAPFDGHIVDFVDPFLRVFINQTAQKEGKSIQNFLKQINKYLKNQSQTVSCLNYLWTLSDLNPKIQAFLWQPTKKTLGIDKQYKIDKKQPLFLVINSETLNNGHFLLQNSLPSIYYPEIESLKHKFNIRKDLASEQDRSNFWIIQNEMSQKLLLWILGILTTIFLILTLATFFLIVLMNKIPYPGCNRPWDTFNYGFALYFALWPLCDFCACFFNFKTILQKNEYVLANAIVFNLSTIIKSLILFICILVVTLKSQRECLQANMYIWLVMTITGLITFAIQVMLRARIIALTK